MGFLSRDKVEAMGFARVGKNVKISDKASFYNPSNISIGDNTRIDDFCILSAGQGGIQVGSYIHIGCYSSFLGNAPHHSSRFLRHLRAGVFLFPY